MPPSIAKQNIFVEGKGFDVCQFSCRGPRPAPQRARFCLFSLSVRAEAEEEEGGWGGGAEGDRERIITSIKNTLDPRHAYLPSRNPPRHSGGADRIAGEVRGALPLPRRLAPVWPRRPCWPWHRCVGVPVSVGECLGEDGSTRLLAGASRAERVPVPPSRRPAAARCPRPLGHRGTGGI